VREALEQFKWSEAEEGVNIVGDILQKEAKQISDAAADLEKAAGK
jgi:hypothetical protein